MERGILGDRHHEDDGDVTRSDRGGQGSNRVLGHLRLCDHLLLVAYVVLFFPLIA